MDSKHNLKQEILVWYRKCNKFNHTYWINESRYWIEIKSKESL